MTSQSINQITARAGVREAQPGDTKMTQYQLMAEMIRVEAVILSPEGKGKLTSLKAYYRKLSIAYRKAYAAALAA